MSLLVLGACKTAQPEPGQQPTDQKTVDEPTAQDEASSQKTQEHEVSAANADSAVGRGAAEALDAGALAEVVGREATTTDEGVVRFTWPRDQVEVSVDGVDFDPAAGLTSWAAFKPTPQGAMLMGDTVVFQDEANPAMDAAFAHGLEVTALHNHFFYDEPKVYFMHIGGHGSPEELAQGVRAVWDAIEQVRRDRPEPAQGFANASVPEGDIDKQRLEEILGHQVSENNGVMKVSVGRSAQMGPISIGASMGLSSWAAFSGTDEKAVMDGDFAMTAAEVQPVLRALRENDIYVVALHNHMVGGEPFLYFTHFWGRGSAEDLAKAFEAVLDAQASVSDRQ